MSSLTENEARQAADSQFVTVWADLTPYALENESFRPDVAGRHALFQLIDTDSRQETMGAAPNRQFLRSVTARLDLWDDVDRGRTRLDECVRRFRTAFEAVTFSGLRFYGTTPVQVIGPDGRGKYRLRVEAPGDYEETK